jgi:hypothetical protein
MLGVVIALTGRRDPGWQRVRVTGFGGSPPPRMTSVSARFGDRRPQAPKLPKAAWINQPSPEALIQTA